MRRSVSRALATVSLTALVTVATSSQAITPATLGTLKQLDKWKVGIVDPQGQSFCAMVNKFDKNFGLAFALSPEGYGSVAVDVTDSKFTPGDVYQVSLKTNGDKAGTYPGRATSERSVVVQVGQNKAFYDALKGNAALGVGLPALNVEFTLNKFAASYRQLVDCSQTLVGNSGPVKMPAVQVKDVEHAPLDGALAEISGQNSDEFQDTTAADDGKDKDALFDAVEAKAENNDTQARVQLASLEQQKASVTAEIGAQKEKSAEAAAEKQQVERKLIASSKASPAAGGTIAPATGATAKLWDAQQAEQPAVEPVAAAAAKPSHGEILWNDAETASKAEAADAEKTATAQAQVDEYQKGKQALDAKADTLKQEAAKIETTRAAAPADKAIKASLVAKQAELARVSQERVAQTQELTRKLSTTQAEYEAKLASITAERDQLKSSLATAQDGQKANTARVAALQGQLDIALAAQKSTGADKGKTDAKVAALQTQLTTAQKTAADEKAKSEAQAAQLQAQLATAIASQKTVGADKGKTEEKLAALQSQLDKTAADKKALEARVATAEKTAADIAARSKQMEAATGSDSKQLAAIKASLAAEKTAHDKDAADLHLQMTAQNQQFEELKATYIKLLDRSKQVSASADKSLSDRQKQLTDELSRRDNYVAQLESKLAVLESERSAAQARAEKAQTDVTAVRGEMQSLRKSLIVVNDDKKSEVEGAKKHEAALAAAEKEVDKAEKELTEAHTRISTLESQLDTTREQVSELQKVAAKATTVASAAQADALTTKTKNLDEAQREIVRLKSNTTELEAKLFNATAEGKDTPAQKADLAAAREKVATAEKEIDRLKSENTALSGKLAETAQLAKVQPAAGGDDMKLAAAQSRLETLEQELASAKAKAAAPATVAVATADISASEMAAEPKHADVAFADSADESPAVETHATKPAKAKIADAKPAKGSHAKNAPVQLAPEMAEADEGDVAPVLSAPLPSRKPFARKSVAALDVTRDVKRSIKRSPSIVDRDLPVVDVAAIEPAAGGDDMPQPILSNNWSGGQVTQSAVAAPVVKVERAEIAPTLAPVVNFHPLGQTTTVTKTIVATPASAVIAVPAKDPSFDENRAAAFLDRIMSHHRPAGGRRAVTGSYETATPVFAAPSTASATPATRTLIATSASLAKIETAAGAPIPTLRAVAARPAVQEDDAAFPAPVISAPLNDAPVASSRAFTVSGGTGIESVLANAGINDAQFTGGNGAVRQWTTGGLSGMYETTASQGHSFGENAQSYVERYRNDCGALKVSMGPVQNYAGGAIERADISCPAAGNTYTTAIVFWQNGGSFNAVLHSGFPDDGATVKSLADSVASAVKGGGSIAASPVSSPASSPRFAIRAAEAQPAVEQQYHFNIRNDNAQAAYQPATYQPASASFGASYGAPSYAAPDDDGDFQTLVIE